MRAYYFGCGRESGHYWWLPGDMPRQGYSAGERADVDGRMPGSPFTYEVDGGMQPGCYVDRHGRRAHDDRQVQGPCRLTVRGGWTCIGWWDRTVDKRGACCSAFVAEGVHDFDAMLSHLRERFPWVASRMAFTLSLEPGILPGIEQA